MTESMKIILIGFMGAGKSTVAALVADQLNLPFIEMDDEIIKVSGLKSIPEIFALHGEATFRAFESEVARKTGSLPSGIISTGGGIVTVAANMHSLKNGRVCIVYLRTSFETVKDRIPNPEARPLLRDPVAAEKLFHARKALYEQWADITIDTDNLSPEEVCSQVVSKIESLV